MIGCIRWAFNIKEWKPSKDQWQSCLQCVQREERERCDRFHFVNDCKASMIGRLLMRKAVCESLSVEYNKIIFSRTSSGKPILTSEKDVKFSFNVSHNGDFCVLASEFNSTIGVDVMKVEYKGKKPLCDYFNVMRKQFSPSEWDFITLPGLEREQLQRFFRLWCLKESYVKATGTGIASDLQTLSFLCKTFSLQKTLITTDTQLFKEGIHQKDWRFEESLLDENHCVAVASKISEEDENINLEFNPFKILDFKELMKDSIPFEKVPENYWEIFTSKEEKCF